MTDSYLQQNKKNDGTQKSIIPHTANTPKQPFITKQKGTKI